MDDWKWLEIAAVTLQVIVSICALRLNRVFGTARAGWSLFGAFVLMAAMYLAKAWLPESASSLVVVHPQVIYFVISILLLVGISHVQLQFQLRRQAEEALESYKRELESRVREQKAQLAKAQENLEAAAREHQRLESEFFQAQKMEAIGRLAGGVAHDFNNILMVIQGNAQLLIEDHATDRETRERLEQIVHAGEFAASLTRQLLAFSRKQKMQLKVIQLTDVLKEMAKMLRRLIGENIVLKLECAPDLPPVRADLGMMEQILFNLAVNARDAMPKGGQLTITTQTTRIEPDYVNHHPRSRAGSFVCLSVRDTGCGMTLEVMARIFEPFYTTKGPSKGTGLGLATVYGLVQQHEGWVEVESTPGAGTVFKIYLPEVMAELAAGSPADGRLILGGHETLLIVEDDDAVREMAAWTLQRYGYSVLQADCGAQALKVWKERANNIHLLLTDIIMPGQMDGLELAHRLQAERPGLKIICTTGYSEEVVDRVAMQKEFRFIAKPFEPKELARAVRDALGKSFRES